MSASLLIRVKAFFPFRNAQFSFEVWALFSMRQQRTRENWQGTYIILRTSSLMYSQRLPAETPRWKNNNDVQPQTGCTTLAEVRELLHETATGGIQLEGPQEIGNPREVGTAHRNLVYHVVNALNAILHSKKEEYENVMRKMSAQDPTLPRWASICSLLSRGMRWP